MSLFSPAWKTHDVTKKDKAIASVNKINDIDKLNMIAQTAPITNVKQAARRRIKFLLRTLDSNGRMHVMDTVNIRDIQIAIIDMTTDDLELERYYLNEKCLCKEKAASKIKDKEVLKRLGLLNDHDKDNDTNKKFNTEDLEKLREKCRKMGFETMSNDKDPNISSIYDLQTIEKLIAEHTPDKPNKMSDKEKIFLKNAYKQRDIILCRTHDSSELRYVSCKNNSEVSYYEGYPYGEYHEEAMFSIEHDYVYLEYSSGRRESVDILGYPFATVEVCDKSVDSDLTICPKCHYARTCGKTRILGQCTCGSRTNPVPMHYTADQSPFGDTYSSRDKCIK